MLTVNRGLYIFLSKEKLGQSSESYFSGIKKKKKIQAKKIMKMKHWLIVSLARII